MAFLLKTPLSLLLCSFFCLAVTSVEARADVRFDIDEAVLSKGQKVGLNSDWYFIFGEQVPVKSIRSLIQQGGMSTVPVPSTWNKTVKNLTDDPYQHGVATYALPLSFSQSPEYALTIYARNIASDYHLYWLPEGSSESVSIGASDDWNGTGIDYFHFPGDSDGLLVVHVTKQNVYLGGIRQPISIQRSDAFHRTNIQDLVIRSIFIGSIFIMCIHYLIQFRYSRQNVSTLFLSILCLSAVLRSFSTAGIVEIFLSEWTSSYYEIRIKLEYMSLLFIPIAYLVFLSAMLPKVVPKIIVTVSVVSMLAGICITLAISTPLMTKNLQAYQIFLIFWTIVILVFISVGVYKRQRFSKQIMMSTLIVGIGGVNDIVASHSALYNVYIAEYVFFIFLFFQAQLIGQQLRDSQAKSVQLSEEKQALQQAHSKALIASHQDHLTGLRNRLALSEMLEQVMNQDDREAINTLGVILFDIDHFKRVNDTYGHDIGDEILIFVASLLHGHSLRANDFKYRYGGEEFLVILRATGLEKTMEVAEDIRTRLEESVAYSNGQISISVTASFGVAMYHLSQPDTLKDVISQADSALYRAKHSGRNCVSL